jgi:GxxExxY protein
VNERELREPSEPDEVVEAVVGAAYEVASVLGAGFPEKVYERPLARELVMRGWHVKAQVRSLSDIRGSMSGTILPIW